MLQKLTTACLMLAAIFTLVLGIAQPANAQSLSAPYHFHDKATTGTSNNIIQCFGEAAAAKTCIYTNGGTRQLNSPPPSDGTPPEAPTLSSPANNATGVSTTPNLQWNASSGATSYQAQVSTASDFNTTVFDQSSITATQVSVSPALNADTTYYWRVNASNSSGTSDWSNVRSFTTGTPPPAPTLSSPANNATGVSTAPTLQWNASSGATSYQVQVSTASDFNTTVFDQSSITTTQVSVSALIASTTYYWRVRASNSSGTSDWSNIRSFTTETPPPAPTLSSPAKNASGVSTTPNLQWNASSGATSYQVQVSTASGFGTTVFNQSDITATQVSVSPALNTDTTYYWRVRASNSSGTSDWSKIRSFTTGTPPPAPTLSSPAENATDVSTTPNLQWNASSGATSYQAQVSSASGFGTTVFNQSGISDTEVTVSPALNADTTYYWRVRACSNSDNSSWSSTWSFTTASSGTIPSAPTPYAPANSATGTSTTPNLRWNESSGATSYQAQVSTTSDFGSTVFNQSEISDTRVSVSPALNADTTYYWRVNASNAAGTSDWSSTWSFTTGSGSGGGSETINTAILGKTGSFNISSAGLLSTATTLSSADGNVQISLNADTTVNIEEQSLTVTAEASPPASPSNAKLINAYDFGPNNTTFDPAITLTLKYDPASLPKEVTESNLYIAFWTGTVWSELTSMVNTENQTVSAEAKHFTVFALLGRTGPPPSTSAFSISNLNVSPTSAKPGQEVKITAIVTNNGSSQDSYKLVLLVNGIIEAESEVTLEPKEAKEVTFTISEEQVGDYTVAIGDQTTSFKVGTSASSSGFNWRFLLIGVLAIGGLLIIVSAIIFGRKLAS